MVKEFLNVFSISEFLDELVENSKKEDNKCVLGKYLLLCVYGLLTSTSSFSVITAIPLLPIGDLIVLCFISPVFSAIWSSLIIKKPLTLLSIVLCIFMGKIGRLFHQF